MWVLLQPGDSAVVPSPSYPIHIYAPVLAGAEVARVPMGPERGLLRQHRRDVRALVASPAGDHPLVPPQPDDRDGRPRVHAAGGRLRARERGARRARLRLRRHRLRRVHAALDPPGRGRGRGLRRALHADEVVLDGRAGASGSCVGNAAVVQALARLKSYLDYGTFQPIQIASIIAMNEAPGLPRGRQRHLSLASRRALRGARAPRLGVRQPKATMFVWAPIPDAYLDLGSLEFATMLDARRQGRGQPGRRLRSGRRRAHPVRARRERAPHRPGRSLDPQGDRPRGLC